MSTQNRAKVVELNPPESFTPGEEIYLSDQYYFDTKASVAEVPKYSWVIKAVIDDVATIEYQRPNWKLLMSIMCEKKYLKREV